MNLSTVYIMDVSVVTPIYNEVESVDELCSRLDAVMSQTGKSYELILVDDGSRDGSWDKISENCAKYPSVVGIQFRRNYGQTAAMRAGIEEARGEIIVMLDADLQNPPEEIPKLLGEMTADIDVVSGWRKKRKDVFYRVWPSRMANAMISKITGVYLHDYGCSLKAYRAEVLKNVQLYGEMHRFIPALADWEGSTLKEVVVDHAPRKHGTGKYSSLGRTPRVVLDLITVKFLLRYSRGPIQMFGKVAWWFLVPGVLLLLSIIILNLVGTIIGSTDYIYLLIKQPFYPITSFMLIFFGLQFISMGLLAEIQIRTYYESQDKKIYNVREIIRREA